jgi:predicted nucleic acid-binding protein
MRRILIDSGPLIALFDGSDRHHGEVLEFLKSYRGELVSSLAVVTEVSHMLDFNHNVQLDFLSWIAQGGVHLPVIEERDLEDMVKMMEKYTDIPMDFADATLVYLSHREGIEEIVSIDSDFDIYRTLKKKMVRNVLHR